MARKIILKPDQSKDEPVRFLESPTGSQTHIVNEAFGFGFLNGQIDVIFTTKQLHPGSDGQLHTHNMIVSRLRFDPETARALRDRLDRAIEAIGRPSKKKMN